MCRKDRGAGELFESTWGVTLEREPRPAHSNMFEASLDGTFRGMYVQGEDFVQSDPNTQHVSRQWKPWNA